MLHWDLAPVCANDNPGPVQQRGHMDGHQHRDDRAAAGHQRAAGQVRWLRRVRCDRAVPEACTQRLRMRPARRLPRTTILMPKTLDQRLSHYYDGGMLDK